MNNRRQINAVVLSVIVVLSMTAPAVAGASVADDREGTSALSPDEHDDVADGPVSVPADRLDPPASNSSRGNGPGAPPGHAVANGLRNASGTVEVFVRVDPADLRQDRGEFPPGNASAQARQRLKEVAERTQRPVVQHARSKQGITVLKRFWITNAVLMRVDTDRVDLDELAGVENVQRLHRNFEVRIPNGTDATNASTADSASTAGATASGTTADGFSVTYGVDRVNATDVWEEYDTRGGGVKVAVLDTGVRLDHPDIDLYTEDPDDPTYPGGWAEFDSEGNRIEGSEPYESGTFAGHGTHVSGTVAGGNASGEYIGVAPNVSLMHGLVLRDGSGSFAQIVAGMQWAVENDADVISMSLGAPGYYPSFTEPVRNAEAAGTVVVAAEGNDDDSTSSPGAIYEAISVGATDDENDLPYFSGGVRVNTREAWYPFAPDDWPDQYVVPDVVAPGVAVKSAAVGERGFGDYYELSGSSMSTPHVAGSIALALSAANDTSVEQAKDAVTSSGWKPADCDEEFGRYGLDGECRPDGQDIGYGSGIADAKTATDRLAAPSGFRGVITDPSGDPVPNATVELGDFDVETDANGEYTLRESAGTYEVTADGFGYVPETKSGVVTAENFTSLDFALEETLAFESRSPQTEAVVPGNDTTVSVRAAHVETWTVTRSGDFDGDATLYVNGRQAAFGEPVEFDDYTGTVNVTVRVEEGEEYGNLTLVHSVSGANESATLTTGPTLVTDEIYDVAVVGAFKVGFGPAVQLTLDERLPRDYRLSYVRTENVLDVTEEYDVFVVQNFGADAPEELIREFERATEDPETGVVYLDQQREPFPAFESPLTSDAISQLETTTNEPRRTRGDFTFATNELDYHVEQSHPIFDGVAEPGENVTLQVRDFGIEYTYFEEYSGRTLASVSLPEGGYTTEPGPKGPGFAIDEKTRTVLAASLGRYDASKGAFTDESDRILANTVEYLSGDPQATIESGPADKVTPGERTTATFSAESLEATTVTVADRSTVAPDDLTLYVNGQEVAPSERVSFDDYTGEVTVGVESAANGSVALETTFESGESDTPLTVLTGSTAVYEAPLVIGRDVDSFETAMTMVEPGQTVYVADGRYVDQETADVPGLTIKALPGATPVLEASDDVDQFEGVLTVEEPDITIEGLRVELDTDKIVEDQNDFEFYYGIRLFRDSQRTTIRNVTIDGAGTGLSVDGYEPNVTDSTISDVTINGSDTGLEVGIGTTFEQTSGLRVEDLRVTNVTPAGVFGGNGYGVLHEFGVNVTYTNVTVENCRPDSRYGECSGFETYAAWGVTLENSTFRNAQTAVEINDASRQLVVRNNTVRDSSTGVLVRGRYFGTDFVTGRVTGNDIAADRGIVFLDKTEPTVAVHYNDLSGSERPVVKDTISFFGGPPEYDPDVRLNYFGPRGPSAEDTREGRYDPFLTEPPEEVTRNGTTKIATDLELAANETRTVGIPGPTDQTVADVLGEDFEGTVEMYDGETNAWTEVEVGSGVELGALDVLRVTPEEDTVAVLTFQAEPGSGSTNGSDRAGSGGGDGPGDEPPANSDGRVILDRGENVVAAAVYGPVETAFVTPSDSVETAAPVADGPTSQLGPAGELDGTYEFGTGDGPRVSPFAGYYAYAQRPNPVEVSLGENPTVYELYEQLGLDTPQLTGLNTNLTEASDYPFEIVSTAGTADANGTAALLGQVFADRVDDPSTNETYDRLVDAGLAAARDASTETTDRDTIERAVIGAVRDEADRIGVDPTPRQLDRIVDAVLELCYRQEDCRAVGGR